MTVPTEFPPTVTVILVHAHRRDAALYGQAYRAIATLAEGPTPWAIFHHCLVEFYGMVTHGGIWEAPSKPEEAIRQVQAWRRSPSLRLLGDEEVTQDYLLSIVAQAGVVGAKIHDARIAAICLAHGIRELWSVDRDFSRFPDLKTRNPLL